MRMNATTSSRCCSTWGLRLTLLLTLPAALAMALLGVPLIATLFGAPSPPTTCCKRAARCSPASASLA